MENYQFIKIRGVHKDFDGKEVLIDLNMDIKEGESLGLIGRSGAGKSILLHMLRGSKEYEPTSGKVIYRVAICPSSQWVEPPSKAGTYCKKCGKKLELREVDFWNTEKEVQMAIKRRIAIMLQRTFGLYGDETVLSNVLKALDQVGYPEDKKYRKAAALIKAVNMVHRAIHITRDLSGGEKQRVVLARQLAMDPMLLLADEPTGTLDPRTADFVHKALIDSTNRGMTMVVTSHWPEAIEILSNQALWLENGRILEYGEPTTVVNQFRKKIGTREKREYKAIGMPKVIIEECKKYYYSIDRGVIKAVDDVSLTINENEIFGLVGVSGSGKTTLSRIITGISTPTSGKVEVRIGDTWVDMRKPGPLDRGRATPYIKILHQEYTLYPGNTVLQNLSRCISLKLPAELARLKALYVLDGSGFDEEEAKLILMKYPDELSVGERHRVALAQVLIREPRIAILDEPTGTMDPITRNIVADSIRQARENLHETFLIISHDLDFAHSICNRIAYMEKGKIVRIE
jgi:methyl coenzyme M reductase system subunit A2